jgi:p-cumate 2,3-dioxygenase alpha subunit
MATQVREPKLRGSDEMSSGFVDLDRSRSRFRVAREAYSDPEIFRRERDTIFKRCWLYLGHGSEIPKAGDFVARNVGGRDLIFSRDRDGNAHALFNACTHRGSTICREHTGSTKVFTCPYHGWVFGLDGKLRTTNAGGGYAEDFNEDGLYNLARVPRIENFRDFWFINFNPNAIPLVDYLAGAGDYLAMLADQSKAGLEVIEGSQVFSCYGNWKLLVENSYDAYHGPSLHASYFEFLDNRLSGENMAATQSGFGKGLGNGHGAFEIALKSGRAVAQWIPPFGEEAKPKIESVYAELVERLGDDRAERIAERQRNMIIFPNLVVNDNLAISVRSVWPTSPDRMDVRVWAVGPADEDPLLRKIRLDNYLTFVGPAGFATPDDIEAFELCQRGNDYGAPGQWSDISKGMTEDEDLLHAEGDFLDEAQMRSWWTQWDAILSGSDNLESAGQAQ